MKSWYLKIFLIAITSVISLKAFSVKSDTLTISSGQLIMRQLPLGSHHYLVYTKTDDKSPAKNFQRWNIEVEKKIFGGKQAIVVNQVWEDSQKVTHRVNSANDAYDFRPLYQKSWWQGVGSVETDFTNKMAVFPDSMFRKNPDSLRNLCHKAFLHAADRYVLNWHLDLEIFSMLPFKNNRVFRMELYDAGAVASRVNDYTVTGSAMLNGHNQTKLNCWVLEHKSNGAIETFWISKNTHEVLKMEQRGKGFLRYKIKLLA